MGYLTAREGCARSGAVHHDEGTAVNDEQRTPQQEMRDLIEAVRAGTVSMDDHRRQGLANDDTDDPEPEDEDEHQQQPRRTRG
jgi:hypothetical protein